MPKACGVAPAPPSSRGGRAEDRAQHFRAVVSDSRRIRASVGPYSGPDSFANDARAPALSVGGHESEATIPRPSRAKDEARSRDNADVLPPPEPFRAPGERVPPAAPEVLAPSQSKQRRNATHW